MTQGELGGLVDGILLTRVAAAAAYVVDDVGDSGGLVDAQASCSCFSGVEDSLESRLRSRTKR